jgi:hypothetical protein
MSRDISSNTQPEVAQLIDEIFGDSDDDDDLNQNEGFSKQFGQPNSSAGSFSSANFKNDDDIFASDEEDEYIDNSKEAGKPNFSRLHRTNDSSIDKKRRRKDKKIEVKLRKRKLNKVDRSVNEGSKNNSDGEDSYASEPEDQRTAADDAFIDSDDDDDLDDYNYKQSFHDEKPKSGSKGNASGESRVANDPLSQALDRMKRSKDIDLTDTQKEQICESLLAAMDKAALDDERLLLENKPAINKLNMLQKALRVIGIKSLQLFLLDRNLMSVLHKWIEPKDSNTLTSLTVRKAIYELLKTLPCHLDHLRCGIGKTVLALRKHRSELPENKIILKEIMEKWSRLIFSKSSDVRSIPNQSSAELAQLALMRQKNAESNVQRSRSNDNKEFDDIIYSAKETVKSKDAFSRVHVPVSNGFMFTVRPDKVTGHISSKKDDIADLSSQKIAQRMKEVQKSGRAASSRPVKVSLNGRNKAW